MIDLSVTLYVTLETIFVTNDFIALQSVTAKALPIGSTPPNTCTPHTIAAPFIKMRTPKFKA